MDLMQIFKLNFLFAIRDMSRVIYNVTLSLEGALSLARERNESEVFICGGAEIYAQSIGIADRMYLTFVDAEVAADTFFPEFDERQWGERESFYQPADWKNHY